MDIIKILSDELKIRESQAKAAVELIDEGNTIPFIARYRKEATGSLDDNVLRDLFDRLTYLRNLDEKIEDTIRLIDEQGKLTEEIEKALRSAQTVTEVDDIYRPFRPKRRTRATVAKEKGLEPLAEILLAQDGTDPMEIALSYIDEEKGVENAEQAIAGAKDIIAENVSDNADFRKWIRDYTKKNGYLVCKAKTEDDTVYRMYYDYREPLSKVASHRLLAVNRGEKEGILSAKIEIDSENIINFLKVRMCKRNGAPSSELVAEAAQDGYERLIAPSVENEVRGIITDSAQTQAIAVFGENLKNLLLVPPVKGKTVMGFDPAYRTGCKIAVVNETGDVLDTTVVYPTPPQNKTEEAEKTLTRLIEKHNIDIISIGNGTASKESEIFVSELISKLDRDVKYMVVSEAGASVYSASKLGAAEFPQFDVSLRSAVSIARRLQDPLAELVKIDPKSIGVGQYQHDMEPKKLSASLDGVVEYCVNSVGVDLNTASAPLLSHISGINAKTAQNIIDFRTEAKRFKKRSELKKVKGIGEKAYQQCAGFLRIPGGDDILDNTSVHPESYDAVKKLLSLCGFTLDDVVNKNIGTLKSIVEKTGKEEVAEKIGIGVPTLEDILEELAKPGRDPRDELPQPMLRSDVMDINSLKKGMVLKGTVRKVADFGAFVDIGVHQDGLVHISQLSDKFVKRAMDVVSVGDIIKVEILDVDVAKKRISLKKVD
ncbi:MAG: RNA-binding transcriptional accessory protein [Clostridia bacterium]|nr:RNA-binding transcriptional accessory protein [Clostridia bacterium]